MIKQLTPETKYTYYGSLTTKELENILKSDFQNYENEESISEDIQIILNILVQREEESSLSSEFDVEKNWLLFKSNYLLLAEKHHTHYKLNQGNPFSKKCPKHFFHKKYVAAMVVFIIMLASISQTTIAKNLVSSVANWSKETFWFETTTSAYKQKPSMPFDPDINAFFSFTTLPSSLLPTWIPDSYTKTYENSIETDDLKMYHSIYKNENKESIINLSIFYLYNDININFEKDSSEVEIYEKDGIKYYIMGNINTNTVIWQNGSFECQIDGTLSREELKKIIDSIPSPN